MKKILILFYLLGVSPSLICQSLYYSRGVNSGGASLERRSPLIVIKAKVLKTTNTKHQFITLEPSAENLLFENGSLQPRQFQLDIREHEDTQFPEVTEEVLIAPNPFEGTTHLAFGLNAPGEIQLTIYNASGRAVHEASMMLGSGKHLIPVGQNLENGIYFCQLRTANGVYNNRIVKVK